MTPMRLAGFEILRRLGVGGMAEVFLAKKEGAEGTFKLLVLKRIHPAHSKARRFRAMFVEEAHLATRLNHPNIVQVYDFIDHEEDGLLLAMEFVDGFDLGKLMSTAKQKGTTIPPWTAAYIVAEAAKGLHYAHERRDEGGAPLAIVHRDVSPQNILLSTEGTVKIADFGIASANLFREEPGTLKGKFGYMSPEQARGEKVDRRSDIYGLGIVLYEALVLRSPYTPKGDSHVKLSDEELLDAVRSGRFDSPRAHSDDVPPELDSIIMRALSRDREDRFQTARDMSGAIGRALLGRQELVDASNVETILTLLLGKQNGPPPLAVESEAPPRTLAAIPKRPRGGKGADGADGPRSTRRPREVRHVSVLTLRLDGISELERALGHAAFKRAMDGLRATLNHIAYKRGGEWFWETSRSPEWVLGVVGLLANPSRAAFDAASLAVDVHEALEGSSEDLPRRVTAGISLVRGIATGTRDDRGHLIDYTLMDPVHYLAERLGNRTPSGKTWVAGGLYRLVRRDFRWADAPALDLPESEAKGLPKVMRSYALVRPLTREERAVEMALAPNDLVGRDAERADLHAAYHRAVTAPVREDSVAPGHSSRPSRGQLVARVVVGEMGIGKTALVASFLGELPREARVISVECPPAKSETPLATLADLLREATGVGPDHSLEEANAVFRGLLSQVALRSASSERLVARLSEVATGKHAASLAEEDGGTFRKDLLLVALRALLGALGLEQALVIVIDGLSWADRSSLEVLHEILRRHAAAPILVILVTRPDDRVQSFIESTVRIELGGLSSEDQLRLVETRLGVREGVLSACSELLPRVAGNPFFLLEMVEALLERGAFEIVERSDGRHELVRNDKRVGDRLESLPSTLEQLIGDRIRELPHPEHDVVDWLAVAGGPLLETDLSSLTRSPEDEAIIRLCARGLCDRKHGIVDFRHPLCRDVAYLALDSPSRIRMHRLLGEHLVTTPLATGLSAAIVARHFARGDAPLRAAELYLEAANAARNANQSQLAQRYYQRVLNLLPESDPRRIAAHEALEALFRYLGRRRERRVHLSELRRFARTSRKPRWAIIALIRTARLELDEGVLARGLPLAQKAADLAEASHHPSLELEALVVASEILRDLGETEEALKACDRAQAVAVRGRLPPRMRAEVIRAKGVLLRYVGRVEEAVSSYIDALAIFRAVGARRSEARVMTSLAFAMFVLERFEDAVAIGLESVRIDIANGGRFQIAKTLSNVGQAFARLGRHSQGLAYLRRAREAHERYADQDARADTMLSTAGIFLEVHDVDGAYSMLADAAALVSVTGSVYDSVHERIIRACLARYEGDHGAAITHASDAKHVAASQALMSFHLYATAIESAARADAGELQTGALLARTALAALDVGGGSEYALEIRSLACDTLLRASAAGAEEAFQRASAHVAKVASQIRNPVLVASFLKRPLVARILKEAPITSLEAPLAELGEP